MSGSNLNKNDEFDEQLRMQELYGDTKDSDTENDPSEETESFGQQAADTPYEWDLDKKAWFPKANYGFCSDGASSSTAHVPDTSMRTAKDLPQGKTPEPTEPRKKGEKRKGESGWFHVEEDRNTNVYVSGLPPDITVDEFIQLMSKFGIIMRDPQTEEFKVKLYKDNQGNLKGDGLCCYLKRESVELALKLLDEDEIRGYKLHVEVAKFQLKGEYDASKKKKKCKDYKKKLSVQQKQLDWRPERRAGPSRMRHERVVILKNMFHPTDFEDDPLVLNEIRDDLRVECSKFGQIKKLLLFDRHPDGVASVSFRDPEEADHCIQTLDGRWFGGRQITAQPWDGTTDYQVEETAREREERLKGWEAFLSTPEANRGLRRSDSVSASEMAGPSRMRHFSEGPSTLKMNAQEAETGMVFEEPINEKKFEKTEDGGEFEEDAYEEDTKEGELEKESKDDCPEKESEEGCPEREAGGDCPEKEFEEGSPGKELKKNGSKRESKKRLKKGDEESSLANKSEVDDADKESKGESSPQKESEEDDSEKESDEDCLEKQSENSSENSSEEELEENGVKQDFDEDGSDKEFPENLLDRELEENDTDNSEFEGSERVLDMEDSEREFDEESDEKDEEETYEKVFDDESDEKEDEEDVDGKWHEDADVKEEDDTDEKLFEDSDEKEDKEDADGKEGEDVDEKLFEDDNSLEKFDEEESSIEKIFDDSDERGTLENVKEEGLLSTGSSLFLSSDDDSDDDI
ncbi:HIV Tat-specific factor 1 isoform X2 [Heterocephalus glaber]|uniref:17S U2 SnRNP complex component HTATSF1 n=1 Tax=Heterocephalus glaber TaxID=10181 RepID=A0AAX6R4D1_HETGA|nr:HIV Tat-specific factor 1 isoform X2 [Heterocephalus glaber]